MAEMKSLKDRAFEKLNGEMKEYLNEVKTKLPDEIIKSAYEITYKEEILSLFDFENAFSDKQYRAVLKTKNALDYLYREWLDYDVSPLDDLKHSADYGLEKQIEYFKKQTQRDGR